MAKQPSLMARCGGELLGTFLLIFFGCGAVHAAVLHGAQSGIWQVAIVWGLVIAIAIYVVGDISGAHMNPAVTIALTVWGKAPPRLVVPYIVSQVAGAMLAAGCLFILFQPYLDAKERQAGVTRGEKGSEITAMCYGEYYPNPGEKPKVDYPESSAFFAEFLGTFVLGLVVFTLTHPGNPTGKFAPVFIGLTVAILISVLAPLTQACFNPARDFGPRLVAYFLGWGEIAIPGPNGRGFVTVYIVAPILGAIAGGSLFQLGLRPHLANEASA